MYKLRGIVFFRCSLTQTSGSKITYLPLLLQILAAIAVGLVSALSSRKTFGCPVELGQSQVYSPATKARFIGRGSHETRYVPEK